VSYGGGVLAGAEVIEAGFGVALFSGEVERASMVATAGGGLAVAEREAGDGFTDGSVVSGADSFGTEPIGVVEDSAARIGGKVATAGEDVVRATVGTVGSVDGSMAGEIVEIEDSAGRGSAHSLGMLLGVVFSTRWPRALYVWTAVAPVST